MAYSESSNDESTTSLLNRHYSTIGIDDVFLAPPPAALLPQSYLSASEPSCNKPFQTWEIVGDIKSSPEDFVVREIASRKRTPKLPEDFDVVADVTPSSSSSSSTVESAVKESKAPHEAINQRSRDKNQNECNESVQIDQPENNSDDEPPVSSSPAEIVERILSDAFGNEKSAELLDQIRVLQQRALERIQEYPNVLDDDGNDILWIPQMSSTDSSSNFNGSSASHRGGNRGLLHRNLRLVFPLLKSETVMHESKVQPPQANNTGGPTATGKTEKHPWICVSIDDTFFGLAPSLHRPESDIPQLSSFRNRQCVLPVEQKGRSDGRKRKRERDNTVPEDDGSVVVLRLRPDLTREERRPVHHLISNACRDFETSTIPDYCSTEDESSQNLAAIVVKWSKRAQQRARKKNSGSDKSSKSTGPVANTFCVLKKTRKEHLVVIKRVTRTIRCRQSDIGLAGIKDMHAVTYQFCTIANISPKRVERAKTSLSSQGIELGRIQQVDWVLNQGDLQGNRFEITIRNVKRIQFETTKQGIQSEVRVPCEREHVCDMVRRIEKSGFVNFYGEQRLGMPGRTSEVGVRAFDIGRALLQQDFSEAIDLLMSGRLLCHGVADVESPEIRHARQVWRETNGDVSKTLKAIPKGDAMGRERIVLQGLKRYGTEDAAAALKCLHFGVRTFWINAYQSYVWNMMASERLKRFGTTAVKGDLYRLPDDEGRSGVRVVTDDSNDVDIADVVLPLPGYAIQYPGNEIGEFYHDFLKKENVCFDRNAPSEATAKGSYRSLISFAQNLEVTFDSFQSGEAPAIEEKKQKAVSEFKLKFDLPSGSYATMLLRELMLTTVAR